MKRITVIFFTLLVIFTLTSCNDNTEPVPVEVPEGKPEPVSAEETVITDKELTCTLSVRCDTILDNISDFDKDKSDIVPKDGVILGETEVVFYEGETVFNLLRREMKKNGIHMEFNEVPMYESAYIEGINNIYEFDCGAGSGWQYFVNDWEPNYGSGKYILTDGDVIQWRYTCDNGKDLE